MSKRKSSKSRKSDAAKSQLGEPMRAPEPSISAADLTGSEAEKLQAALETETKLPEAVLQDIETTLPAVPSQQLESESPLPAHFAQPESSVASPVEASESPRTTTEEAGTAGPPSQTDGPRRAMTGMNAWQTLFREMTRDNLDFAASLATVRTPFDVIGAATTFAGKRIDMYGRFSKAVADIAAGRSMN